MSKEKRQIEKEDLITTDSYEKKRKQIQNTVINVKA